MKTQLFSDFSLRRVSAREPGLEVKTARKGVKHAASAQWLSPKPPDPEMTSPKK